MRANSVSLAAAIGLVVLAIAAPVALGGEQDAIAVAASGLRGNAERWAEAEEAARRRGEGEQELLRRGADAYRLAERDIFTWARARGRQRVAAAASGGAPSAKVEAPTAKAEAPAAKADVPAAKAEAPAAKAEAPAEKVEAPAAKAEAPAAKVEVPAAKAEAPAAKAEAPAAKAEAPAAKAEAPTAKAEAPAVKAEVPAVEAEAPAVKAEVPAVEAEAPAAKAEVPAAKVEVPAAKAEAPAAKAEAPAAKAEAPAAKAEAPAAKAEAPAAKAEALAAKAGVHQRKGGVLTVASWGGAYQQSQDRAFFTPFTEATGIRIKAARHAGSAALLGKLASVRTAWDVIDVSSWVAEEGCRKGFLEPIDKAGLAPAADSGSASDDFLPGALKRCAVASVAWSSLIVYDRQRFKKRRPTRLRDFFDVKRYPGKRALPKGPRYVLEMALIADGVARDHVYDVLATDKGVARAFAKLARIRDHIVWWTRPQESLALLARGEVAMTVAYNGRVFVEIGVHARPWGEIWDGQIYDLDYWVIPKGASGKSAALRFIAFATRPDRLAEQSRWFPYGPTRRSALKAVGKHRILGIDMAPFLPTSPANFGSALQLDTSWWAENEVRLKGQFAAWLSGRGAGAKDAKATGAKPSRIRDGT